MADIAGALGKLFSFFWDFLIAYWLYIVIVLFVIWDIYRRRTTKNYRYHVRTFMRRENDKRPENNYIAGYFKDKNGVPFFRIKMGRMPWEKKDMYDLPDARYMDDDNRVFYEVINPNVWVQVKRTYIPNEVSMKEIRFVKDYGVYKAGFQAYIQEDHVDVLARAGAVEVTGKEYKIEAADVTYKPISSSDKRLIQSELWDAHAALRIADWKTTAVWVGGIVGVLLAGLLAYLLVTGQLN